MERFQRIPCFFMPESGDGQPGSGSRHPAAWNVGTFVASFLTINFNVLG